MDETIHSFLEKSSSLYPEKIAVISDGQSVTYKQLEDMSNQVRNYFSNSCKGQRIGIILDNSIDFIVCYFGILKAACTAFIIPTNISDENLLFEVKDCSPDFLIYEDKLEDKMKRIGLAGQTTLLKKSEKKYYSPQEYHVTVSSKDVSTIIYTSGTTGSPKGVKLLHENVVQATKNINLFIKNNSSDIYLSGLPLSHSFGLGHIHVSFMVGGTVIIEQNFIHLVKVLQALEKHKTTMFAATPKTLGNIVKDHRSDFKKYARKLRMILTNTGPIDKKIVEIILEDLPTSDFNYYYGLTEASRSSFINFAKEIKGIDSVGKASPNTSIEIRDGEICIAGKHVIEEYWNNPVASQKIKNGWLYTGDCGYFDSNGYLHVMGRIDDIINVNGEKVHPLDIEYKAKSLDLAAQVVAVGAKDAQFGEVVHLYVVSPKFSSEQILQKLKEHLEPYKLPRKVFIVDSIPMTDSGKIKRKDLRHD
ncbi:long-chain fatty acid--CoA ligase [Candidatus Pacearchaeota archaeon]|nr:long-chain fatty acid--CoA ligase [Candidatus Pacearchaeota archaeon]